MQHATCNVNVNVNFTLTLTPTLVTGNAKSAKHQASKQTQKAKNNKQQATLCNSAAVQLNNSSSG